MADSSTTKLSLTLPEVDVSTSWPTSINNNFTTLDESVLLTNTQILSNKTFTDCDATTQTTGDNSTKVATTAFVNASVALENTLAEMDDVTISSVADNDIIAYDSTSSKYINQSASEAGLQPTIADGDLTIAKTNGLQSAINAKLDSSAHTKASLDVDHLITLSGVTDASDNLGTFTGSTIADSSTIKTSLQSLETAVETKQATISSSARLNADLIHDGTISNTEFGHLNGVSSNIQTQLNSLSGSSVTEDDIIALSIALG